MDNEPHIPVMLAEVIEHLDIADGDHIVDGTFGAGGYSRAILNAGAQVTAIDRDPDAIANGQAMVEEFGGRLKLVSGRFGDLDELSGELVDGVVLDIGVSSMQLDQAERGFSFRQDGPLDMRMEQQGLSAADVVNHMARTDLTRLIGIWGEDRKAPLISKAIEKRRSEAPFATTLDLARLVEKTIGQSPKDRIHPATRTFQALRIFVNRELHQLCDALFAAERALKPGGRLVVVTFHSL
jgi:16S rRNA (cytosine1402-N4)-methyltransferase